MPTGYRNSARPGRSEVDRMTDDMSPALAIFATARMR